MSNIVLLHPPFPGKFNGKPLGLVSIATALRNVGHEVNFLDLNAKPLLEKELREYIKQSKPDVVGIASTSPTHLAACNLARQIKESCDIPIIKGGTHEMYCFQTTLERHPEIDISVRGPGEDTIVELVHALEQHGDLSTISGIAYKYNSQVKVTPERPLQKNLDDYPHPDRTLLKSSDFYNFGIFDGTKTTQVRMSRGCSYGCNFCPIDRTYRFHSADYVLQELKQIKEQGYGALFWDDAIFTANRKLLEEVLTRIIEEGLEFKMGAQTRADVHINPKTINLMKRAGFTYLSFGVESGDPQILERYNKRLNLDDVKAAVEQAKEYGIKVSLTAIVGAPEETLDSVKKTIEVINLIKPDAVSWSAYSIYPGSLLEFDPLWYEDSNLSKEPIWLNFDEGYQAKHVKEVDYFEQSWEIIKKNIRPEIKI